MGNGLYFGFAVEFHDLVTGNVTKAAGAVQGLNQQINGAGTVTQNLNVKISNLSQSMNSSSKSSWSWANSLKSAISMVSVASGVMLARKAFSFVGGIRDSMEEATKVGADFGYEMARVGILVSDSKEHMGDMTDAVMKLSQTSQFSAIDTAKAMQMLGQQGVTFADDIVGQTKLVLNLATVGQTSVQQAGQFLSDTMAVFQGSAGTMTEVADALARGANIGKFSMQGLQDALKEVAPLAKLAGMSLNDTIATLNLLKEAGLKEGQAGTSLRNIMAMITRAHDGDKFSQTLSRLGIDLGGLKKSLKDPVELLTKLRPLLADQGAAYELFGLKSGTGPLAALVQGLDKLKDFQKKMGDTSETLQSKVNTLNDTLKVRQEIFNHNLDVIRILWTQTQEKSLKTFYGNVNNILTNLMPVFKHIFNEIVTFAQSVMTSVFGSGGSIGKIIDDLSKAPSKATNGAIQTAVDRLIVWFTIAKYYVGEFFGGMSEGWTNVKDVLSGAGKWLLDHIIKPLSESKVFKDVLHTLGDLLGLDDKNSSMHNLGKGLVYVATGITLIGIASKLSALALSPLTAGILGLVSGILLASYLWDKFGDMMDVFDPVFLPAMIRNANPGFSEDQVMQQYQAIEINKIKEKANKEHLVGNRSKFDPNYLGGGETSRLQAEVDRIKAEISPSTSGGNQDDILGTLRELLGVLKAQSESPVGVYVDSEKVGDAIIPGIQKRAAMEFTSSAGRGP